MANLVLSEDKKNKIKNVLCSSYGAKDVIYKDLSYGILISIIGTDSFRFIKSAIIKELDIEENTLSILTENEKDLCASYVYMPEKDKVLNKKLKKMQSFKF